MDTSASGSSALTLTSGGNRGAVQAGAPVAPFEQDCGPDLIFGVSAGGFNGSMPIFYPTVDGGASQVSWLKLRPTSSISDRRVTWTFR